MKKRMRRSVPCRLLSLLMSLSLLAGLLVVPAAAAATGFDTTGLVQTEDVGGTTSDGIVWTIWNTQGVSAAKTRYYLRLETNGGSAVMSDYGEKTNQAPWMDITGFAIREIYVGEGITKIGSYAFYGMSNVDKVTIGSSVQRIDTSAFSGCSKLATIDMSNCASLTTIGASAFSACGTSPDTAYQLTSLDLSACTSLTAIGASAFAQCDKLQSVDLRVGTLTAASVAGSIFSGDEEITTLHLEGFTGIPDSLCSGLDKLTAVYLGNNLSTIGTKSFYNTYKLDTLSIPAPGKLTSIGNSAFQCQSTTSAGLKTAIDFSTMTSLAALGTYAFCYRKLNTVDLSKTRLTSVPDAAFHNCSITSLSLPDTLTTIGSSAFSYNSLINVTIPSAVKSISNSAFSYDKSLQEITVNTAVLTSLGDSAFGKSTESAFSATETVEGVSVTTGQKFYFASAVPDTVKDLFINGTNCYIGESKTGLQRYPAGDVEATCTSDGKTAYVITYDKVGGTVSQYTYDIIPALGHLYDDAHTKTVYATCTSEGYTERTCTRTNSSGALMDGYVEHTVTEAALNHTYPTNPKNPKYDAEKAGQSAIETIVVKPTATKAGYTIQKCALCGEILEVSDPTSAVGYDWKFDSASGMTADTDGSIIYKATDTDGTTTYTYTVTIPKTALTGTAGDKLSTVALPELRSADGESEGTLTWTSPNTALSAGTNRYAVTFTPAATGVDRNAQTMLGELTNADLTVSVTVAKRTVSFAGTYFTGVNMVQGNSTNAAALAGIPAGASQSGSIEYADNSGSPVDVRTAVVGTTFTIKATFTYDQDACTVAADTYSNDYTLTDDHTGTVTLTAPGTIVGQGISGVTAVAAGTRTYDGQTSPALYFSALPDAGIITYTGIQFTDYTGTAQSKDDIPESLAAGSTVTALMTTLDAGTYTFKAKLTIGSDSKELGTFTVTVKPKELAVPAAAAGLVYNGTEQTGVASGTGYAVTGGAAANAGSYTATLTADANHCWAGADTAARETTAAWSIGRRGVSAPESSAVASVTWSGSQYVSVTAPGYYSAVGEDGTLTAYLDAAKTIPVYTVTDAAATAVGDYTPTAALASETNLVWNTTPSLTEWRITAAALDTSGISFSDKTVSYNGADQASAIQAAKLPDGYAADYTYYSSWSKTDAAKVTTAIDAGTYYVTAVFSRTGYASVTRTAVLTIEKANVLRVTAQDASVVYDGSAHSLTYSVAGYFNRDDPTSGVTADQWSVSVAGVQSATAAGEYGASFTVSHPNYVSATSNAATLSITKRTQTIVPAIVQSENLEPISSGKYTVAYGGAAFTLGAVRTDVTPNVSAVGLTYKSSNETVATMTAGQVNVHGIGTTNITITAAESDDISAATTTLELTVERAGQTVHLSTTDTGVTIAANYSAVTCTYAPEKAVAIAGKPVADYDAADASTGAAVSYASSDASIASVDAATGALTIHAAGTATVTMTVAETAYCKAETQTYTLTVSPDELIVAAAGYSGTYDKAAHDAVASLTVTASGTELASGYTVQYSTDAGEAKTWSDTMPTVTNVGDSKTVWYKVTVPNYKEYTGSAAAAVSQKEVTITADNQTMDYMGAAPAFTAAFVGFAPGDTEGVLTGTLAYAVFKGTEEQKDLTTLNAGTYVIRPSGLIDGSGNYKLTFADGTLTVNKISGAATVFQANVDYGAALHPTVTMTKGTYAENTYQFQYRAGTAGEFSAAAPTAPGTYQVIAVLPENANYLAVTTAPCTFAIAQIKVPVTLAERTVTYDGAAVDEDDYAKAVYSAANANATYQFYSDAACTAEIDPPTDAGIYYLKATVSAPNYSDGTAIAKFTISPKEPAVTIQKNGGVVTSESTTYGAVIHLTYEIESGVAPTVTVSQTDYVTADLDTTNKTLTLTVQKATAAQQTVTVTLHAPTDGKNYKAGSAAYTLTVSQAPLAVTASAYSGTYDGSAHNAGSLAVKNSSGAAVSATVYYSTAGALTAANYGTAGSTAVPQVTNVADSGKTIWYCVVDPDGNYAPQPGSYAVGTISPAPITETIDAKTSVYGDTPAALKCNLTSGTVYNTDDLGVSLACTVTSSSAVGSYDITGSAANKDYKVTFVSGTGAYAVTARPVTVTIGNQTAVYSGGEPTVDPAKWQLTTGSMANSAGAAALGVSLTKAAGVDAGSYAINGAASNQNYAVTFVPGSYLVDRKPLTDSDVGIAAISAKTYTGAAQTPGVTVTYGKLTLTQNTDYTLSYSGNTNVTDAAQITITAAAGGNYSGTTSATFKIAKAPLTVTAEAKSKLYGGAYPDFTVTYTGFVNGETEAVLGGTLAYAVKKGETAYTADAAYAMPVGSYSIAPSGYTSGNYAVTFAGGTLTVSAKALKESSVKVTPTEATLSKVYTGAAQEPTISVGDTLDNSTTPSLVRGTDYTVTYAVKSGSAGSLSGGLPVGAGTYTVTLTGKGNYTGSVTATDFVITPKTDVSAECTAALAASSYTYDGSAHQPAVTVKDQTRNVTLAENQDYTKSYSGDCTNVGTKTVTVTFKGNYSGTLTAQYDVVQKSVADNDVTVKLGTTSYTYSGSENKPSVTVTYNGTAKPALGTDYTVAYTDNINAGTATVTVTGIGTNYTGSKTVTFAIKQAALSIAFTDDVSASACSKGGNPPVTLKNDLILKNTYTGKTAAAANCADIGFDGTITYESSNTNVAAVDDAGVVTMTTNPGNAKITAAVTDGGRNYTFTAPLTNYFLLVTSADITANITANISGYDGDYDGTPHGIAISDVVPDGAAVAYSTTYDVLGTNYTETNPTYTAAGTHTVYYRITAAGYNPRTGSAAVTIRKADAGLSFTGSSVTAVYGGTASNALTKDTDAAAVYASSNPAVAAADADGKVTVLGVGTTIITATTPETANYEAGSAYYALTITAKPLAGADVVASGTCTYTGSLVTPAGVAVTLDGKTLAQGTDYTLSFSDNLNAGAAAAIITGVGNYSGTAKEPFTIQKAALSALTLQTTRYTYTGSEVPVIVSNVTAVGGDGTLSGLRLGTDYTLTYGVPSGSTGKLSANGLPVDVGSYTVTAAGAGNYTGSTAAVAFTVAANTQLITVKLLSGSAEVTADTYTYTGSEIKPVVKAYVNGTEQSSGYAVTYLNNTSAGTATANVAIQGVTVSKAFTINQANLAEQGNLTLAGSFTYNGIAQIPAVSVTGVSSTALTAGTDYTVSMSNESSTNAGGYGHYGGCLFSPTY